MSPATVNCSVRHAHGQRHDRVDWSNRASIHHTTQRTEAALEDVVPEVRRHLQAESDLVFFEAEVILRALWDQRVEPLPSERTIYRILRRRGVLGGRHRVRRPSPPPGWYLRELACRGRELDSFDVIEWLFIRGGPQIEDLNGISLHRGLVVSWLWGRSVTEKFVAQCLVEHWRQFDLPGYALFDNDTIFQGTYAHSDAVGRVSRLCLGLGIIPVFVLPREPGFQAAIERYNGSWQVRVWMVYVRRLDTCGRAEVLGRRIEEDPH